MKPCLIWVSVLWQSRSSDFFEENVYHWGRYDALPVVICRDNSSAHCLVSFVFPFRAWKQLTTTPLPHPTTPSWCLTTKAVAPLLAPSAPCIPPQAAVTRTTTTSVTGVRASEGWLTCMVEGMINNLNPHHLWAALHLCSKVEVVGGIKKRGYGVNMGFGPAVLYYHETACKETPGLGDGWWY